MMEMTRSEYRTGDGLTLVADVGGPADAATIMLLHGGGQTRHSWSGAMRRMIGEGYHVINFDARGHGDSSWSDSGDYSLKARGADLQTVIGDRRPVALVGASMGGMTSFYAAGMGQAPQATALILVDIVLRPAAAGVQKIQGFMKAHDRGFANIDEALAAVVAYNPERKGQRDPSGLMKNLRLRDDGRLYWHWDPRMMAARPSAEPPAWTEDLLAASSHIHIPTLLVRGGKSDIVDDEGVAELVRLVPQTEVYCVPEAGHMVAGDRNDAFNDGVLDFLHRIRFGQV
ncbi:alpha/beta hydrolase [Sphingobium sp. WCS2017Hpa-17]|uniref:alpha/beta fold hydrolase n=1 Tax=Sphingobium sp. WCS2017Hpa-17 TaxID=3073638 RepID=UPI00288A592E|nr:alpha/beta hydrolase [Sphingobium sp. WCS2017Hpa-17]